MTKDSFCIILRLIYRVKEKEKMSQKEQNLVVFQDTKNNCFKHGFRNKIMNVFIFHADRLLLRENR